MAGYPALHLVGLLFKDVSRHYPVQCYEIADDLEQMAVAVKRILRVPSLYQPRTCGDIAGFFRAMTTIDPQWAGCPNAPYSAQHLEKCIRNFLDRGGAEDALRHMIAAVSDGLGTTPEALRLQGVGNNLDDQLKILQGAKNGLRQTISEADNVCRVLSDADGGAQPISQIYGNLAINSAYPSQQNSKARFEAVGERRRQVVCKDIISLAFRLHQPETGSSAASVAEQGCRHEAAIIYEAGSKGRGIPWDKIDGRRTQEACREALSYSPDNRILKLMLARGLIVDKKSREGWEILENGVRNNDAVAMMLAHDIFHYGIGVALDKKVATDLMMGAAQGGNPAAQSVLGSAYYYGDGVERNLTAAADWLNKAGKDRLPAATTLLGIMHFNGEGVSRDDARAVTLLQSVQKDDCLADFYLALARESNRGGFTYHGTDAERFGLSRQYSRIAVSLTCPTDIRQFANTRANKIYSLDVGRNSGPKGPGISNSVFEQSFAQAVRLGRDAIKLSVWGRKTGIISEELNQTLGRINSNNLRQWHDDLEKEKDCKRNGYNGGYSQSGCY
jgi:TPR repeat protein